MKQGFFKRILALITVIGIIGIIDENIHNEITGVLFNSISASVQKKDILPGTPYKMNEDELMYDVTIPHIIINQFYGADKSYSTHSFIELYNPTVNDVDLSTWSLQYISSKEGPDSAEWKKLNLTGVIPSHCSYLVRCGRVADTCTVVSLNDTNSFDIDWNQSIYTKGCSVALIANQKTLPAYGVFDNNLNIPVVDDYVDLLSASGNDITDEQQSLFCENGTSGIQSKKKGIRRNSFEDTDNNKIGCDSIIADFSFASEKYISWIYPKSVKYGEWEENNSPSYTVTYYISEGLTKKEEFPLYTILEVPDDPVIENSVFSGWYSDIELTQRYEFGKSPVSDVILYAKWSTCPKQLLIDKLNNKINEIPKYYDKYCTEDSVKQINDILQSYNNTNVDSQELEVLQSYYDNLDAVISNLKYNTGSVPQIFISTKKENGNEINKIDGYQDTSIIFSTNEKTVHDNNGLIKVRGNTTAEALKKPFTIKFSTKTNLCGMGKAKKYCLIANCFDPTLLRNYVAMRLASELGLNYTPDQQYVELWIDGVYKGCYQLMEEVEKGKDRVDIDIDNGDFLIMYEKSRTDQDATYFTTSSGSRFEIVEPETPNEQQLNYIQTTTNKIYDTLKSNDFDAVKKIVDVNSIAKFCLLNEYMKTLDVTYSSVYFYYKDGKLYGGPAWDFDLSSGNAGILRPSIQKSPIGIRALNTGIFDYFSRYDEFTNILYNEFMNHKEFLKSFYLNKGLIDSSINEYGKIFEKNFSDAGWHVSDLYYHSMRFPDETYSENVDYLKNWFKERYIFLDDYYTNLHNKSLVKLKGHSISLSSDIGVNFYISIDKKYKEAKSTAYFTISYKNKVVKKISSNEVVDKISYNVCAKDMREEVTINFYESEGEKAIFTNSYSVDNYITDSKNIKEKSVAFENLIASIENYGVYADKYFNVLGNTDIKADLSVIKNSDLISEENSEIKYTGTSILLESKNILGFYFNGESPKKLTAIINGKSVEINNKGNNYYIEIPDISVNSLNKKISAVVKCDNDIQFTITESILGCAKRISSLSTDSNMKNVLTAVNNYYDATNAYIKSLNE